MTRQAAEVPILSIILAGIILGVTYERIGKGEAK
jgi:hypothetical protein